MKGFEIAPALELDEWKHRRCGAVSLDRVDGETHVVATDPDGELATASGPRKWSRAWRLTSSLALAAIACKTWQVQPGTPTSAIQWAMADSTRMVRLTLLSGATTELYQPTLVADSIIGLSSPGRERVAFAAADVRSVARHEISAGKTALAGVGIALSLAAILFVAVVISFANSPQ